MYILLTEFLFAHVSSYCSRWYVFTLINGDDGCGWKAQALGSWLIMFSLPSGWTDGRMDVDGWIACSSRCVFPPVTREGVIKRTIYSTFIFYDHVWRSRCRYFTFGWWRVGTERAAVPVFTRYLSRLLLFSFLSSCTICMLRNESSLQRAVDYGVIRA